MRGTTRFERLWSIAVLLSAPLGAGPGGAAADDPPLVEILASTGAVDGPVDAPAGRPHWERVRLELRVENRLPRDVRDLQIELSLWTTGASRPIPGWTFKETFSGPVVGPTDVADLRVEKSLPARRKAPPADDIAYRVTLRGYRVHPPDLDTAIEMLGSPRRPDQQAAVLSFDETAAEALTGDERRRVQDEVALALETFVAEPSASDALRMLMAIRTVGSLGLNDLIADLVALPDRLDRADWGRAMIELASRMVAASQPDDPRLEVLPPWAREESALLRVRAEDALPDAIRDAVNRMGDSAVPALLLQTKLATTERARDRARRLLAGLGRNTARSQLQLRETEIKVQVVRAFGRFGAEAPLVDLVALLGQNDEVVALEAARTLEALGPRVIRPLVGALGHRDDDRVVATLERLARRYPAEFRRWARHYGADVAGLSRPEVLKDLRAHRRRLRRNERLERIASALAVGRAGRFIESFAALDRVFDEDPELYGRHAPQIAALYRDRARLLYVRGNYDAAVRTAKTGLTVFADPAAADVLADAQLALVFGFIELGDLQQAREVLDQVSPTRRVRQQARLRSELWAAEARRALDAGEYSLARALVDRARALRPDVAIEGLHRRLLIVENYAVLLVLALLVPGFLLAVVLRIHRAWQQRRLLRQARRLDQS